MGTSDGSEPSMGKDVSKQIEEEANRIAEEAKILSESAKLSSEDETMEEQEVDDILVVDNDRIYMITNDISNVMDNEIMGMCDMANDANEIIGEEGDKTSVDRERKKNEEGEGDAVDGKKMERKLSLMDVDEEKEEDLVTVMDPFEQDKCAHEDIKCGQVEPIEEAVQPNTDG